MYPSLVPEWGEFHVPALPRARARLGRRPAAPCPVAYVKHGVRYRRGRRYHPKYMFSSLKRSVLTLMSLSI